MHFNSKFNKIFNIFFRILLEVVILPIDKVQKVRFLVERMLKQIL